MLLMQVRHVNIQLVQKFFLQLIAQGGAAFGALALSIIIGIVGGAEGLGQFAVLMALMGVLQHIACRGQPLLLFRTTAWTDDKYGRATSRDLAVQSVRKVLIPSLVLGMLGSALLGSGVLGRPYPGALVAFPFIFTVVCMLAVLAGYMRGTDRAWASPMLEIGGVSSLAALISTVFLLTPAPHSAHALLAIFGFSAVVMLASVGSVLAREARLPNAAISNANSLKSELEEGQWAIVGIALGSYLIQTGSFLLGAPFLTDEELGLLRAAERFAIFIGFPVLCMVPLLAPRLVLAIRDDNSYVLRSLIIRASITAAILGGFPLIGLLLFPAQLLGLMGEEFVAGENYLRALAILQFAAALVGPLALILTLSGREKTSMYIHLIVFGIGAILIPVLSYAFGKQGFVTALAVAMLVRSLSLGFASGMALIGTGKPA